MAILKIRDEDGKIIEIPILKGRDFVQGKYLPIATYKLDTTLQTIEANTFTDSTGIIK